ncbi:hypothetical protein MalM25_17690 [Planctomycetes bacterium MalM25]|nr:hypothetical protein MalM25_17690 [Planctomycetes bacterium MalM25]
MAAPHKYRSAITPGLRWLFRIVLVLVALLGANSVYLTAITALEATTERSYQNYYYQYMFLGHLVLGLLLILPFLVFGVLHMRNTWRRKNRRAVRMGYFLFAVCLLLLISGLLLTRAGPLEVRDELARQVFYWLHVISPLVAIWAYWLHRLVGPPIKWRVGAGYLGLVGTVAAVGVLLHQSDPRSWYQVGSPEGVKYFEPSLARTSNGKFISERALMNDDFCRECHADTHASWAQSAHRFSSFNNPAYLASIRETREYSAEREGSVRRARWCAGCHDPAPFFTGKFDDPNYDDVRDPTAHAGITCTACHAITHINSTRGNADYTIEEPLRYPFAYSKNPALRWINRQLVKAKPEFHKQTFLKPFHRDTDFCSVCHKVHLPEELNEYKFLRGQNHHDSFMLSGVSGGGARSFYYPPKADANCNRCHMPLAESDDFGARRNDDSGRRTVHDHLFVGGNTALPHWRGEQDAVERQQEILRDCLRIDLFGLREEGKIEGALIAPLRPVTPELKAGKSYLIETVIRTLTLGHHFTQGTADSNEVWVELTALAGDRVIGRSGAIDENGRVDPWSHFVNVFMLDREGNRIDRRNAQDIFVPLYNHQIPPGAGQSIHYRLNVPEGIQEPITIEARVRYRKFDRQYLEYIAKQTADTGLPFGLDLPITTLASDRITLPVVGGEPLAEPNAARDIPAWQRWNDYGIGLLLKGVGELRQAEQAFTEVEKLGRYDGPLNLARVLFREGRLDDAVEAAKRASEYDDPPAPPWTLSWLSGQINRQQGRLEAARENFAAVLSPPNAEMRERGFDFRGDYEVINLHGQTLFDLARRKRRPADRAERDELLRQAEAEFKKTLRLDAENATAHYGLQQVYAMLGDDEAAALHRELHGAYKPDDNARDRAVAAARARYPAANHAAEAVVIYDLDRDVPDDTTAEQGR